MRYMFVCLLLLGSLLMFGCDEEMQIVKPAVEDHSVEPNDVAVTVAEMKEEESAEGVVEEEESVQADPAVVVEPKVEPPIPDKITYLFSRIPLIF